ncbi:ABC transporter permease [Vibrio zhugei]|uniref:ABC transporter permease n=1 Tax=Vibrio zhugei TaxID=2479546 RepID=A0ABV7CAH0_9VIBR|nr:ABC transporter permease [Vibrio zhugei]
MSVNAWTLIKQDKWLQSAIVWMPLGLALLLWWIFSQGIVRALPVGVVDLSHSERSRQVIRNIDATSALNVIRVYPSQTMAKSDLIESHIYAYTVIPRHFDRDIQRHQSPKITTFYNSQYILTGRLISSAMTKVMQTMSAQIDAGHRLAKGNQTLSQVKGEAVPVGTQLTPLFNLNMNYAQFLVSGIIPALWQIAIVTSTILVLSTYHQRFGLITWLGETPFHRLADALWPFALWFAAQGIAFIGWFYYVLDWPQQGQLWVVVLAQWLTIAACIIMGGLFYFITLDPARALSFSAAYTAPSFAFMGITFPASNMDTLAQVWRNLLPVTHYIKVQINQVNYDLAPFPSLQPMLWMTMYLIPLLIGLGLVRLRLRAAATSIQYQGDNH